MMLLPRLMLILVLLTTPQPANRNVHVVFAQPLGETFTVEEQAAALQSVHSAIAFWQLAPEPVTLNIISTQVFTFTDEPYRTYQYYKSFMRYGQSDVYVMIVDNSSSRLLFDGVAAGFANEYYGFTGVVLHGFPSETGLAATIAHELGHVLYHLPDLYHGACATDIMCYPVTAYQSSFIGCASLEALGRPCKRVYVPLAQQFIPE